MPRSLRGKWKTLQGIETARKAPHRLTTAAPNTQPWPATKTIWTYKAIYRADDDPARRDGHWSQAASVTVGG